MQQGEQKNADVKGQGCCRIDATLEYVRVGRESRHSDRDNEDGSTIQCRAAEGKRLKAREWGNCKDKPSRAGYSREKARAK